MISATSPKSVDQLRDQKQFLESMIVAVDKHFTITKRNKHTSRILIVDDESINLKVVHRYLQKDGFESVFTTTNPFQVEALIREHGIELLLLDIVMPGRTGLDILKDMKAAEINSRIPVIMLTASTDPEVSEAAFEMGAMDFLRKPFDPVELIARINNVLLAKAQLDNVQNYARSLELAVSERTSALENSRREIVNSLARASEYRDDVTGNHIIRVGKYSRLMAEQLGYDLDFCDTIELAARLHDVGKIGISDRILLKPGRLTDEEFAVMQTHVDIGMHIIQPSDEKRKTEELETHHEQEKLLEMAARIAISHHERFDGHGYPNGLSGEEIPIEGRIVAIADVFDALSTKRPYKPAFPTEECFVTIYQGSGLQFDPNVVNAFLAVREEVEKVVTDLAD
ncbi:MAG: response regulator [Planctomycetaceae bacterium]|nr:response regulator [Planctomycetaceae bacterium]